MFGVDYTFTILEGSGIVITFLNDRFLYVHYSLNQSSRNDWDLVSTWLLYLPYLSLCLKSGIQGFYGSGCRVGQVGGTYVLNGNLLLGSSTLTSIVLVLSFIGVCKLFG